jgi:tetratricopeptide (TPR) repeat protein
MKNLLSLFALIIFSHLSAQDYGNKVDALELCTEMQTNNFSSSIDAENALEKILNVIGASKRFVLQPCNNINNAVAVSYKGIRYILYDNNFMNSINNMNNWGNLFILAHEVGHHINGHSLDLILYSSKSVESKTLSQRRKQELEADEFAGFIIAKLGGNIIEINKLINKISSNKDDIYSTHPNTTKRLNAIKIGYNKALNKKTVVYENKNNLNTAEDYLYEAIEKFNNGDIQGAISDNSKAIELNPKFFFSYINRGICKMRLKDFRGAIVDFNLSLELNPNYIDTFIKRGISKNQLKDNRGAIEDYNRAIELNPNSSEAYYNRCISKGILKDYQGSILDCNKVIELSPNFSEAYLLRGRGKTIIEDNRGAIEDYNRAIELNPNSSEAYYGRGLSKLILKEKDSACLDLSKAGELGEAEAYDYIKQYCN